MVGLEKCLNLSNGIEAKVRDINRLFANDLGREESLMFLLYKEEGIEKTNLVTPTYCGRRAIDSNGELAGYSPHILEFYSRAFQEDEKVKRIILVSDIVYYFKF